MFDVQFKNFLTFSEVSRVQKCNLDSVIWICLEIDSNKINYRKKLPANEHENRLK